MIISLALSAALHGAPASAEPRTARELMCALPKRCESVLVHDYERLRAVPGAMEKCWTGLAPRIDFFELQEPSRLQGFAEAFCKALQAHRPTLSVMGGSDFDTDDRESFLGMADWRTNGVIQYADPLIELRDLINDPPPECVFTGAMTAGGPAYCLEVVEPREVNRKRTKAIWFALSKESLVIRGASPEEVGETLSNLVGAREIPPQWAAIATRARLDSPMFLLRKFGDKPSYANPRTAGDPHEKSLDADSMSLCLTNVGTFGFEMVCITRQGKEVADFFVPHLHGAAHGARIKIEQGDDGFVAHWGLPEGRELTEDSCIEGYLHMLSMFGVFIFI